jgi:hypothetical protein
MNKELTEKRDGLKMLILHLKGFNSLDGIEVPPWVRPAVKQWLAAGYPDRALAQLEGQLAYYQEAAKGMSKEKMIEALGLTKADLAKHATK